MRAVISRRGLLLGSGFAAVASESAARYETPYKLGKLVLSASPEKDAFDSRSVDCPFVFQHDGQFHMTYVAWDGTGYQTGLTSSRDLVNWTKLGCILKRDASNPITRYNVALNWIVRENAMRSPGRLKKIRGRFLGVYHAYPNAGYEQGPAVIGICWSKDLMRWDLEPPCLRPEDGASWERGGLYKPCIVEDRGSFYIFYNAKTADRRWFEQTGVVTSKDLKTWTRFDGNPIIRNGGPGSPDERFASDPCVVRDGGTWAVFYFGLDAKGVARDLLATGPDLFSPRKVDRILIDVGPKGSIDETYAHKPAVVWHNGALYHFYCAVAGGYPNEVRGISVARSRPWG